MGGWLRVGVISSQISTGTVRSKVNRLWWTGKHKERRKQSRQRKHFTSVSWVIDRMKAKIRQKDQVEEDLERVNIRNWKA